MDRRDLTSRIDPPQATGQSDDAQAWPGARLGLAESGRGSVARLGPRVVALFIDWIACSVIAMPFGYRWGAGGEGGWLPLVILFIENFVLVGTLGSTLGHVLVRMRVIGIDGSACGPRRALVRAFLLVLCLPPLIWDKDSRGLHDRLSGTVLLRTR